MKHTLSNNTLTIKVDSLGAELQSLFYIPKKVEFLWQGDEQFWARQAPILFPIVGKLQNDELKHNNQKYFMSQHGFARDCEFSLISENDAQEESALTFRLQANNLTKTHFPFDFELTVTFTLNEQTLTTTYTVLNSSKETLPFSLGGHPAFNWPLTSKIKKQDHKIIFNKTENNTISQLKSGLIKVKKASNPTFKKTLAVNESLFSNDALIFEKIKSDIVKLEGRSATDEAFIEMHFSDFNDFGIWKKPGADFICLEPWLGYSSYENFDGEFSDKAGLMHLNAGETISFSFDIKVGAS